VLDTAPFYSSGCCTTTMGVAIETLRT